MKILTILAAIVLLAVAPSMARGQQSVLPYYYSTPTAKTPVGTATPLPVTGSFSASGFHATAFGTPLAVDTVGETGSIPNGATELVVTNVGATVGAYCALGAAATTSSQYVAPNGGWFGFSVSAETQVSCITATGSTTVNLAGGAGLPTGTGGGGGSGGGAVTIADGASVTLGAKADSVCGSATGTCTEIALMKFLNNAVTAAVPAGTNLIGKVGIDQTTPGTTNGVSLVGVTVDACAANAHTYTPISISSATTTQIVAATSAKKTYVCSLFLFSAGAQNVGIVEGTGGTCAVGTAGVVGGTTAATGPNLTAQTGFVLGAGNTAVAATAATNTGLCLITSGTAQLSGVIVSAVQ